MKTTITHQLQLEEKAINAMIAFERRIISRQELDETITLALRFYGDGEGHRKIVLKGWIIKTIYALDSCQLAELDRIACQYETTTPPEEPSEGKVDDTDMKLKDTVYVIRSRREMIETAAYKSGNWEIVKEHIAPAPGEGGAHLYAIPIEHVRPGEWIYDANGNYIAERIDAITLPSHK